VSGIDAYPESPGGDDPAPWTESSPMGDEFLAQVSKTVEDEASRAEGLGVRVAKLARATSSRATPSSSGTSPSRAALDRRPARVGEAVDELGPHR
jgi:hypothetical protein